MSRSHASVFARGLGCSIRTAPGDFSPAELLTGTPLRRRQRAVAAADPAGRFAYSLFVCRLRGRRTQPVVTLCGEWQRARLELIGDRLTGCLNAPTRSGAARRRAGDTDTGCEGEQ